MKVESKDPKYGEGLHIKEKWNPNKRTPTFNFNPHRKPKPQNFRFRDKNKTHVKSKNPVRKCYYCGKTGHIIKDCFKKISDMKDKNYHEDSTALICKNDPDIQGVVLVNTTKRDPKEWVLDSGCTFHMCPNKEYFSEFVELSEGQIQMGNDMSCLIKGIGKIKLSMNNYILELDNCRYVPELKRNLISLGQLDDRFTIVIQNGLLRLKQGNKTVISSLKLNGIYTVSADPSNYHCSAALNFKSNKSIIWHKRLGHISEKGLNILNKLGCFGKDKIKQLDFCENCILGKQKRLPFKTGTHKSSSTLDYLHASLWGPASVNTLSSFRFYLLIVDDFSRKIWTFLLKHKSDTFKVFKQWKLLIENQTNMKIKALRTDNGLEFCNSDFDTFCKESGILRHRTVTYTPQQNGVAERMNRYLLEKVRCMLYSSGLPKFFWGEALKTATYLINRSPSSAIDFQVPEKLWSENIPDYARLKFFGCTAYSHQSEGKLEPRSLKCVFLGYGEDVKGYRLWVKCQNGFKVIISRNVIFNEDDMPCYDSTNKRTPEPTPVKDTVLQEESESVGVQNDLIEVEPAPSDPLPEPTESESEPEPSEPALRNYQLTRDRERREIRPSTRFSNDDFVTLFSALDSVNSEPVSFNDAINCSDSDLWKEAMKEEMDSLMKNKTWVLVDRTDNQKVIDCKWIYKIKQGDSDSEVKRYKARLVAKGFTQKEGIDYNEIFSPVAKYTSIRILLALTAHFNWELDQLDVKTAFLNGDLFETIYMNQPEGFVEKSKADKVCLLKKSLYGLKQAPRQWYIKFNTFVQKLGFARSKYDSCFFFKGSGGPESVYLLLYVDDMLLACHDRSEIDSIKSKLKSEFEMKDLGEAKRILGMEITRDRNNCILQLRQCSYVKKILEKFSLLECKPVSLPIANHFKLTSDQSPKTEDELYRMQNVPYANTIGSIMYLMVCTRPDLAHSISILSRFMSNPGETHWLAVKWMLRYLKGSSSLGLEFKRSKEGIKLKGYTDSDFAGDVDNRRSTSSYIFTLCDGCISWKSQLQKLVALSSTEAEYIAACDAVKESIWLKGLLNEISFANDSVDIYTDNQSAIHLSKNPVYHDRTKHIDIKFHFVRSMTESGLISLVKIPTEFNPSDMGTKVLPSNKFQNCLKILNITGCDN